MAKASAPSRDASHPSHAPKPHAQRTTQAPLGPALRQAVVQGHAFGEQHVERREGPSLEKKLKRLG